MRSISSPPCGGMRWLVEAVKCEASLNSIDLLSRNRVLGNSLQTLSHLRRLVPKSYPAGVRPIGRNQKGEDAPETLLNRVTLQWHCEKVSFAYCVPRKCIAIRAPLGPPAASITL